MAPSIAKQRNPPQPPTFQPGEWPTKKTIDVGKNGVTVSADPLGGIYQISAKVKNPEYALMIAAPWAQFDPRHRRNPAAVREYRKHMERRLADKRPGLGLRLDVPHGPLVIKHVNDSLGAQARIEWPANKSQLSVQTVLDVDGDGTIIQATRVTNTSGKPLLVPVSLDVSFAVSRASYGQLTDQGEVKMPAATNKVAVYDGARGSSNKTVCISNEDLGSRILVSAVFHNVTTGEGIDQNPKLFPPEGTDHSPPSMLLGSKPKQQILDLGPRETLQLICAFRVEDMQTASNSSNSVLACNVNKLGKKLFSHGVGVAEPETTESSILWANINYITGCCSVPLDANATGKQRPWAVVPDHVALPLGWPRDNYWQLKLLMKLKANGNLARLLSRQPQKLKQYEQEIQLIVTGHLHWLFNTATIEVPVNGTTKHFWRRSYLINGRPKDGTVYQLDTQLYPFLELCDFYDVYGSEKSHQTFVKDIIATKAFTKVLADLLARQDAETKLFKTDETPADDDIGDYPFHLSSNILTYYTLKRLAQLLASVKSQGTRAHPFQAASLHRVAEEVRQAVPKNFICPCTDGSDREIFAYGVSPSKAANDPERHRRYHDGNDMPTVFAGEWGFLKAKETDASDVRAVWQNTMEWAFTPDPKWTVDPDTRTRTPGYNGGYAGNGSEAFHGLGSDHSEGAWVLGFFQEWRFAQLVGDKKREARAWAKIKGSMQWDGTFSEAVDLDDGKCTSKTWFSWPGAMIAENLVDAIVARG